jgi:hypothetical protein
MRAAVLALALCACGTASIVPPGGGGDAGTNPGDKPVIASFVATPDTLAAGGGPVTLAWSVTGADTLVIDPGIGPVTGSSAQATVTATTAFTLSASNAAGTTTKTARVTVGAAANVPVILSFTATPATLPTGGGQTQLTWQVQNADSVTIDHGVGAVTGTSAPANVGATTVFTLTATNGEGSSTSATAVVVGQNPSSDGDRYSRMVAPTDGESFVAPTTLRLVAAGHDPNVFTNTPTEGHGGNASKVQFFVDDTVVLEMDGLDAEYWVFKGFANGVVAGQHRVWARAIFVNPAEVLDSIPAIVTVGDPPAYDQTVDLSADVVLSGSTGYELVGAADKRIRLNGNGHQIRSSGGASGPLTLKFVDVFDLGDRANTSSAGIGVTTSGAIAVEDSIFDGSDPVRLSGAGTTSIRRNVFRSNMRMPIGQYPDASQPSGPTYPVAELGGSGNGAKVFAGNNVAASFVTFSGPAWVVGGDTDADSNVLIGPRVGISAGGSVQIRRNYSHHVYYGGWSQGSNFELGGGGGVVAEHNVIIGSSWPVRGVAGEFRYNLVLEAGHQWLWADHDGGSIHHNVFIGGEADVGGLYVLYAPQNVRIFNNTIDGQGRIGVAVKMQDGMVSFASNLLYRVPSPGVAMDGGALTADYNLFFSPSASYSDGRTPAHDVAANPNLADPIDGSPLDLDEVGVWKRTTTVRDVLSHYRGRYTPQAGSPPIDAGDPAGGAGNDIGAVGAGEVNAADRFGQL